MKPFDLQAAINGEPIQTRDGCSLKFVAYVPEAHENCKVMVRISGFYLCTYPKNGQYLKEEEHGTDIVMASVLKKIFTNSETFLYEGGR
jgi:hypothetical protein